MRGFDFGNSPTEIEAAELPQGAAVVLSTTNGTRASRPLRCLRNANVVADKLGIGAYGERVAIFGCGWEYR